MFNVTWHVYMTVLCKLGFYYKRRGAVPRDHDVPLTQTRPYREPVNVSDNAEPMLKTRFEDDSRST